MVPERKAMSVLTWVRNKTRLLFAIDLRTLALFRISLAFVTGLDFINRLRLSDAFYASDGVLPRSVAMANIHTWRLSLNFANVHTEFQILLIVLGIVSSIALLLGTRTRLATFICWLLMLSLNNRNQLLLQAGDTLIVCLLFWSLFLPLGARFSVDYARDNSKKPLANTYCSLASFALLAQSTYVYIFGALLKTAPVWIPDGLAVNYSLRLDMMASPIAVWLREFHFLNQLLTYFVWGIEISAPILLFFPFFHTPIRLATLILLIFMHIGFFACLKIGLFAFISITSLLAFTPSAVWDWLKPQTSNTKPALFFSDLMVKIQTCQNGCMARWLPHRPVCTRLPRLFTPVLVLLIALVFAINLENLKLTHWHLPRWMKNTAITLQLQQRWDMFAPQPAIRDGWVLIEGRLQDDTLVDVYRMRKSPPRYEKPDNVSAYYGNYRWRKYLYRLSSDPYKKYRKYYARYLCRQWNKRYPEQPLANLSVYFIQTINLPNYQTSPVKTRKIIHSRCLLPASKSRRS